MDHFTCIRWHRQPANAATPLPLSHPHNHVSPGTSATTASTTKVSISRRSLPKPCLLATMGLALSSHPSLDLTGWVRAIGCRRSRTICRSLSLHHHRRIEASTCRWLFAAARHHGRRVGCHLTGEASPPLALLGICPTWRGSHVSPYKGTRRTRAIASKCKLHLLLQFKVALFHCIYMWIVYMSEFHFFYLTGVHLWYILSHFNPNFAFCLFLLDMTNMLRQCGGTNYVDQRSLSMILPRLFIFICCIPCHYFDIFKLRLLFHTLLNEHA
jgi:hypothetical protein